MIHRHVSGPHFRDYHLPLDEQAAQIFGTTDTIAEHANETARRHGSDG
jgi:starvation-inducible DNA-binding protein